MTIGKGFCMALVLLAPTAVQASVVKARVSANSGPWNVAVNRKLAYGKGDEDKPTVVPIFTTPAGTKVKITADGSTAYRTDGTLYGPDGDPRYDTGVRTGNAGGFPSQYVERDSHRRASVAQLLGAFVDGDGVVIGEPFLIGSKTEVEVPKGAVAIAMGVNDYDYADNEGFLNVKVTTAVGTVTVE